MSKHTHKRSNIITVRAWVFDDVSARQHRCKIFLTVSEAGYTGIGLGLNLRDTCNCDVCDEIARNCDLGLTEHLLYTEVNRRLDAQCDKVDKVVGQYRLSQLTSIVNFDGRRP